MKITLLEPLGIPEEVLARYQSRLEKRGHQFTAYGEKTTDPAELIRRTGESEIVILANNPYPAEVVEAAPNLKMLDVAFTGIDHVALDACKRKGVMLCNAAGYSTQCVAVGGALRGREIGGRTVGIVGTGAIGTMTARLFQAFGAKVIAYSRTVRPEVEEMGISYVSLETLMAQSDIVSLHLPSNPQTKGMISRAMLQKMKPTAILINVARGAVVDNTALAEALNQEKIAGAGIDVFDMEPPLPETYPLLRAKHTVLTPHVAFATEESMLRRAEIVFRNVEAYLDGCPENVCPL